MRSLFILLGIYASVSLSAILPAFTPPKVYKVIDATSYMGLGNETSTVWLEYIPKWAENNSTPQETSTVAKRAQGSVYVFIIFIYWLRPIFSNDEHSYFCNDPNFTGYCVLITGATSGGCVALGPDLDKQVSSIGPDPDQSCYFFR
jgi:hypothetical protein